MAQKKYSNGENKVMDHLYLFKKKKRLDANSEMHNLTTYILIQKL